MAFGQAAAISAFLALRYHKIARDVPVRQVQDELLPHVAAPAARPDVYLSYLTDVKPAHRHYRAIQYLVSRGFTFGEETFKPDAPTTGKELALLLQKLAERGGTPVRVLAHTRLADGTEWLTVREPYAPYMGHFTNPRSGITQRSDLNTDTPVTRATMALWLCRILNWPTPNITTSHYADVSGENQWAIEALYDHYINAELWDGLGHRTPDDKLLFKPDAPLSHADLFATLYLAQIGLGPAVQRQPRRRRKRLPRSLRPVRDGDTACALIVHLPCETHCRACVIRRGIKD